MVGRMSLVGSLVNDCPCFCLNAMRKGGGGDFVMQKSLSTITQSSLVQLSSPFLDSVKSLSGRKDLTRQRKKGRFLIVNEVAGQYEDGFEDVKSNIVNYITYKAVRTVLNQLYEMNPPQYRWLYEYIATNKLTDGKSFIRSLAKEKQELAERVMITRLHLYGKWIKKCDHAALYKEISDQNLELMRERLMDTDDAVKCHQCWNDVWSSDLNLQNRQGLERSQRSTLGSPSDAQAS